MHILLREWNFNAGFFKSVIDRDREFASSKEPPLDQGPAEQSEIKRAVSEAIEYHHRRWISQDRRMLARDFKQDIHDSIGIGAISDADRDADSAQLIGKRPIHNPRTNKLAIGNDDIGAIRRAQYARAKTYFTDLTGNRPDLDVVAELDRMLKYQNETRDKIVHQVLQTEADADAESADQKRDSAKVDTRRGQGDQKPQQQHAVAAKDIHGSGHTTRQTKARE